MIIAPDGQPLTADQWRTLRSGWAGARLGPDGAAERAMRWRDMLREGARRDELTALTLAEADRARSRQWGMSLETPIGFTKGGKPIYPIAGAAEKLYLLCNSSQATTAAPVEQPTGTAIRTMLQIEAPSTKSLTVVEWGVSYDGTDSTQGPIQTTLFRNTVAATMSTATVAADITLFNYPSDESSLITLGGTTHTGFATAAVTEGTVANAFMADIQQISPTAGYVKQWPLGREFNCPVSKLMRVRITSGIAVNAYMYVIWAE